MHGSTRLNITRSARLGPQLTRLDFGPYRLDSTWAQIVLAQLGSGQVNIQPKIQKYEFGFETNPFKLIKTNIDLDNYGLDFVIWIFSPPLTSPKHFTGMGVFIICNY